MPIIRKGSHAIHFAHVPRTGGRSLLQAFCMAGWSVDSGSKESHPHPYFDATEEHLHIPSFAVVRDPVDRFISACKFEGLCSSQQDILSLLRAQSDRPTVSHRHFQPQSRFVGPHTMIFKYEEDLDKLLDYMRFAGLVRHDHTVGRINSGSAVFEVDKSALGKDLMKVRRWYVEDYRRFAYIGSKA